MSEETLTIEALIESNEILLEECSRLRTNNKILRTSVRMLRDSVKSLRNQIALAQFNDETFKSLCSGEFSPEGLSGVSVAITDEGGLPKSGT